MHTNGLTGYVKPKYLTPAWYLCCWIQDMCVLWQFGTWGQTASQLTRNVYIYALWGEMPWVCECVLAAGIIRVSQYCVLYSCTHFFPHSSWLDFTFVFLFLFTEKSSAQTKCEKAGKSLRGESRPRSKRQCEWLISSPARDGTVILKFDLFDFPKTDSPCSKDYVEVRNGQTEQAPVIGRFCGSKPPQPIQSSGNALWVRYVASGQLKTEVRLSYTEGARRSHQSGHLLDSGMNWIFLPDIMLFLFWMIEYIKPRLLDYFRRPILSENKSFCEYLVNQYREAWYMSIYLVE